MRDEIRKLKEAEIQRPNIIGRDLCTLPNVIRDVRKRDDKSRTFAPPDNTTGPSPLERINKSLSTLKNPDNTTGLSPLERINKSLSTLKNPDEIKRFTDFNIDKSLNKVINLIKEIKENITEGDNIVDLGNNKQIYFRDLFNFLHDIKDGKISDFNKEIE